ncbi:MAG: tRNA dihydrouridine(20/20a) synthase DusA [Steroidobacteraceae bacterium]
MKDLDRRVCTAPMMDYTDRHYRYLMRLLSPSVLLYTEMIAASAIVRGDGQRLLSYDPAEHPVALQLGGSDPGELARAARIGADFGYDEINLNCGCPSDRVQNGRFGACLMGSAEKVAECVEAMRATVNVPVTVKCRIGIEPRPDGHLDDYETLSHFVRTVSAGGCDVFIVHARIAVLRGLSPKENREIPPLRYDDVARLHAEFPEQRFVLNGGLQSRGQILRELERFDGVMIGREAYGNPYLLAELHRDLVAPDAPLPERQIVLAQYGRYVDDALGRGERLAPLLRPLHGLYAGLPGVRSWRRYLSEQATGVRSGADILQGAMRIVAAA